MTQEIVLTCAKGSSELLADEVRALGLPVVVNDPAFVETRGETVDLYRLNLHLRTAHRVLARLKDFRCVHPDALYRHVNGLPWEEWIDPDSSFMVHNSVSTPSIRDTRFASLKVKDAIVDRVRDRTGRRPDSGRRPDGAAVFLHWRNERAAIYLDLSGVPLSRRGYRTDGGDAPMQEALAASMLLATGWDGDTPLVNPMCGSGTLAIEAAWIAMRRAPGIQRENFALQALRNFDRELWQNEWEEARKNERPIHECPPIHASDHDPACVERTLANAQRAGVTQLLDTATCDFAEAHLPSTKGWIVMNPEYGIRLGIEEELKPHYRAIGDWLKQKAEGWNAAVFTGNIPLSRQVGLKPYQRLTMYNGALESRLLLFEMFAGTGKKQA